MIVTIADCAAPAVRALVAENLALLRARAGRKVLLLDTGAGQDCQQWSAGRARAHLRPAVAVQVLRGQGSAAGLERLRAGFDDVVIVTDGCGGPESRWALIAAQVAVVPLAPDHVDIVGHYQCIARLNSARVFHPGLRVLFVAVSGERAPAPSAMAAVHAYAAQLLAAEVAQTSLHLATLTSNSAEMAALYGEVYRTAPAIPLRQRIFGFGLNT